MVAEIFEAKPRSQALTKGQKKSKKFPQANNALFGLAPKQSSFPADSFPQGAIVPGKISAKSWH
jgi:hypothetical protein